MGTNEDLQATLLRLVEEHGLPVVMAGLGDVCRTTANGLQQQGRDREASFRRKLAEFFDGFLEVRADF